MFYFELAEAKPPENNPPPTDTVAEIAKCWPIGLLMIVYVVPLVLNDEL